MDKKAFSRMYRHPAVRVIGVSFLGVSLLMAGGLYGYYLGGHGYPPSTPAAIFRNVTNSRTDSKTSGSLNFGLFWQAWNAIDDNFFGDQNPEKRLDGAISGMVAGLGDPYTMYLPPSANKLFTSDLQGSFGGIGAELTAKNGFVTVVAPLEGTPAEKAGLKAQDVITQVGDKKVEGMTFNDVIDLIRGDEGSQVTLTVVRSGEEQPLKITLTRAKITVKSVTWHKLGKDNSAMYIKLNQFGDDTTGLFQQALQEAKSAGSRGLVIDLRNNPGGYLEEAAKEIGLLIPQNPGGSQDALKRRVAVVEHFRDGTTKDDLASTQPILDQIPIVLLVNGGSASASEIFSGALRDYGRATLVGTKTFGKGSAQQLIPLSNGGSVKITIAKWFTPLGTGIDGKGLEPDTVLELPKDATPNDTDIQVDKALQILGVK